MLNSSLIETSSKIGFLRNGAIGVVLQENEVGAVWDFVCWLFFLDLRGWKRSCSGSREANASCTTPLMVLSSATPHNSAQLESIISLTMSGDESYWRHADLSDRKLLKQ